MQFIDQFSHLDLHHHHPDISSKIATQRRQHTNTHKPTGMLTGLTKKNYARQLPFHHGYYITVTFMRLLIVNVWQNKTGVSYIEIHGVSLFVWILHFSFRTFRTAVRADDYYYFFFWKKSQSQQRVSAENLEKTRRDLLFFPFFLVDGSNWLNILLN